MIQIPKQVVLPVCPHARSNRLSISVGEQQQHVQDIKPVYNFNELFNRVWIVEISPLRHMSHEQVMPHKRLNFLCLVRIKSKAVEGSRY